MSVNVVRDALSVTNRETSAWDRWREAPSELRTVSPQELETLENLRVILKKRLANLCRLGLRAPPNS
jgi:hypothetical protein